MTCGIENKIEKTLKNKENTLFKKNFLWDQLIDSIEQWEIPPRKEIWLWLLPDSSG